MSHKQIVYIDVDKTLLYSDGMMGTKILTPLHYLFGWKQIAITHRGVTQPVAVKANKSAIALMQALREDGIDTGIMTAGGKEYQAQILNKLKIAIPSSFIGYEDTHMGAEKPVPYPAVLIDDCTIIDTDLLKKLCFICGIAWERFTQITPAQSLDLAIQMAKRHLITIKPYKGNWINSQPLTTIMPLVKKKLSTLTELGPLNVETFIQQGSIDYVDVNTTKTEQGHNWYHALDASEAQKNYSKQVFKAYKHMLSECIA